MSKEQTIFRVHREQREQWTPLLNQTICDPRLSFRATGLLVYLLSKPSDWQVRQSQLADAKTEGRDAVLSAFRELQEHGYIFKEIRRDAGGKIADTLWHVFEVAQTDRLTGKPEDGKTDLLENRKTVKPEDGFSDTTKDRSLQTNEVHKGTTETKTADVASVGAIDFDGNPASPEIVMKEWNALGKPFPAILKLSENRRALLRTRLKDQDWVNGWREALRVAKNVPFLRGEEGRGWVMDFEFFLKPDSVTKILEGKYGRGGRVVAAKVETVGLRTGEAPKVVDIQAEHAKLIAARAARAAK